MDYNETIFLHNFRKYATYQGFQRSLAFGVQVPIDPKSQIRKDIVAIDAIKFEEKTKEH
jgi:hypothetical protein